MVRGGVAASTAAAMLMLLTAATSASAAEAEPSKCPHCSQAASEQNRQSADALRLEAIKQQILSKLGLRQKPNITWNIPREVILQTLWRADGVRQLLLEPGSTPPQPETDDYYARTAEIITFAERGGTLNGQTLLEFSNSHDNPHSLRVKGATLWVQLRFRSPLVRQFRHLFQDRKVTLYVFRAHKVGGQNSSKDDSQTLGSASRYNLDLLTSSRVSFKHVGWKKLDLQDAVQRWFSGPLGSKFTVLIDCSGCGSLVEPIVFEAAPDADGGATTSSAASRGLRPFLAIVTEPVPQHRVRRRALECDSKTTQCCKQSLYVSFRILEWDDWIIAPQGYYANYCMGDCARRGRTPDTFSSFHTHVIEEYKNRNPYAVIQQCCAPTKLAPMSLIYFDQDSNIIKTDLPNMIVDECGCA
uniref:TGF-beta family profile domain-containing protein n=1 Tax=Strigamia maritima TaxID=126957 RepID=T1JDG1_STRMM